MQLIVSDNTNADPGTREHWTQLARKVEVPIRCIYFTAPPLLCQHNDTVRALNEGTWNPEKRQILPHSAFSGYAARFTEPKLKEGFQDITYVPFQVRGRLFTALLCRRTYTTVQFRGDDEKRKIWSMYWI